MILYRRYFLNFAESWFEVPSQADHVDIVRILQAPAPLPSVPNETFETLLIDLRQDAETLFAQIDKGTRYEIRRAEEKDRLQYETTANPGPTLLAEFFTFYDEFAALKKLLPLNRERLTQYAQQGVLTVSCVRGPESGVLTWHAYYCNSQRARLLHSASHFRDTGEQGMRNLIGRANRFHHWRDILAFKDQQTPIYDFGGIYSGSEDQERLQISRFKEKFGGARTVNYNIERPLTWKGKLFLTLRAPAGDLYRRMAKLRKTLSPATAS